MTIKLGIGTRLFLAFAGITALSLASGGVGWWILDNVSTAQTTIVKRAMPAVVDARRAAEISARIIARSPLLTNAATQAERLAEAEALFGQAEYLGLMLERMLEYGYGDAHIIGSQQTADGLLNNLKRQNSLVSKRIDFSHRLSQTTQSSISAAQGLSDLTETLVANAASGTTAVISNLYELIESQNRMEESLNALDRLYEKDVFLMERMFELRLRPPRLGC